MGFGEGNMPVSLKVSHFVFFFNNNSNLAFIQMTCGIKLGPSWTVTFLNNFSSRSVCNTRFTTAAKGIWKFSQSSSPYQSHVLHDIKAFYFLKNSFYFFRKRFWERCSDAHQLWNLHYFRAFILPGNLHIWSLNFMNRLLPLFCGWKLSLWDWIIC